MKDIEVFIRGCLFKEKTPKDTEVHFVAKEMANGMVAKIWYRAQGDENKLVRYEVVTSEAWDWEKAGVTNNEEWRAYLNRNFFKEYSSGLVL